MRYAQITGWGMHVPPRVLANDAFVEMGLDTSDEWIASRTGIQRRRIASDEATSDLAVKAAQYALQVAGTHPRDLDQVIVATCTPDQIMPSTASLVQDRLGASSAGAMDVNAACAGFVYALSAGAAQIEAGRARRVLVIGADELSRHLDWRDRSTCVLFGDGAGAVVLERGKTPGILASTTGSDGSGAGLLAIPGGGSRSRVNGHSPANGEAYLYMNGPQIFRWATQMMARAAEKVVQASGLKAAQVDLLIPHQANLRIMDSVAKRLRMPEEKVFANVGEYGNTSAASIPIALCEAIAAGQVSVGQNIVMTTFGAGLSWGAVALRWTAPVPTQVTPWAPIRMGLETRLAAMRSAIRRQERAVRAAVDERLRREKE